ncbi:ABC transporter transmembrane domain-containing protein [Polaribacter uvawellassae]|uniref:ABC transporter transmembrane domain-containing protein n=1 Tax=Polaribacter uvawellassae TaxID=3133495 RepID=UPI003219E317
MAIVDQQLKHNDCGISAIKTIYNIYKEDISRSYIQDHIFLNESGSRITDIYSFFEEHKFDVTYKLIDVNSITSNAEFFKDLFPFILPVEKKGDLHYLVVNEIKGKKLKVLDPENGRVYFLTLEELKRKSHLSSSYFDILPIEEKLRSLILDELKEYQIEISDALKNNDKPTLFNKLTYFSYHKENFGFKDTASEEAFLKDLIFNQEISFLPKSFRSLKYKDDKVRIKAPLALVVKTNAKTFEIKQDDDNTTVKEKNVFLRLIKELGSNKKLWNIYIFTALFAGLISQFAVFINQILIDNVLPSFQLNTVMLFAIGVGVFALFELVISQYKRFVSIHLGNILDKFFLSVFDTKLNTFSIQYTQTYRRGDLTERLSDSLKLKSFFLSYFTRILVDVIISISSLIILFVIQPKLTLVVLVVIAIYFAWFKFITPFLKSYEHERFKRKANLFSKVIEKIEGLQVIKNFRIENVITNSIITSVDNLIKTQTKLKYINLLNTSFVSIVRTGASLFIIVFLARDAITNQSITIGQIITFLALSGRIISSLGSILSQNLTLQEHEVILKRYYDFNEKDSLETFTNNNGIKDFEIDSLELKDISFGFFPNQLILNEVNFKINKGEIIQIEGRNGTGKSTFSKILSSLYKPKSGSFIVNNSDSSFYNKTKLKEKLLLITNEDVLFNESIYFNITLGKKVSTSLILKIAKKIELYDFIISKEDKLSFIIQESGKNLSTGQRKKILLMRGLLSNAEILVIDEVLSGIDKESRSKIESLINDFNKTIIIISHEPIEDINFNKKYHIQNGKLIAL